MNPRRIISPAADRGMGYLVRFFLYFFFAVFHSEANLRFRILPIIITAVDNKENREQ
jgi:hypothetical protein